jgi:hypothetical protein
MNCTEQEFQTKIWTVDPNYCISSDTQDPGYRFGHPASTKNDFLSGPLLSFSQKISKSVYVWHNGKVIKDCTGLFIPLPNPATPVYLNVSGQISSTPGNHRISFPGTQQDASWPNITVNITPYKSTCECGAHKVGSNQHSGWCQMKELA